MQKRFQFYTKDGIKWSEWYEWNSDYCPKYQLGKSLLNEYRE